MKASTAFWLDPILALADYRGLKTHELKEIEKIIDNRQQEFKDAWNKHFSFE